MRRYSQRRRDRDAVYPERREVAFARSGGICEARLEDCTTWVEQVHHLAGRTGPDPHRVDLQEWQSPRNNLLAVCASCHQEIHNFPARSRELGLMRSRLASPT